MERRTFLKLLAASAARAALEPVRVRAVQNNPDSPVNQGCSDTEGPEEVAESQNLTHSFFEEDKWGQNEPGVSSLTLKEPTEAHVAVSFEGGDTNQTAQVETLLTNGNVVTGTIQRDPHDNRAWFQPEGLSERLTFTTTGETKITATVCDGTDRVYAPIVVNQ